MNRIIALLVIAQFICLSQSAQVKRASDACPGTNNKASTSKEYAYLSKRSAAKDNSDFSKPKYQSIYNKKATSNPVSASAEVRRGRAATTPQRVAVPKKEKEQAIAPKETTEPKKVETENEFEKAESSKPYDVIPTEKVIAPKIEKIEKTVKAEGKSTTSHKKEKAVENTKATNKALAQQKRAKKKLCFGKKGATSCPEF